MDFRSDPQIIDVTPVGEVGARNKVLRNTYALLALTMVPTTIGAAVGVYTGFQITGFLPLILLFAGIIGFQFLVYRHRNSSLGVVFLLAFTGAMGFILSNLLNHTLNYSNGATILMYATGGTAAIMLGMSTIAGSIKRDISGWGSFLIMGLWVMIAVSVIAMVFSIPALYLVVLTGVLVICSALLIYDTKRILDGGETNYVVATMHLYLDLFNIFSVLLQLFGIFGGDD